MEINIHEDPNEALTGLCEKLQELQFGPELTEANYEQVQRIVKSYGTAFLT